MTRAVYVFSLTFLVQWDMFRLRNSLRNSSVLDALVAYYPHVVSMRDLH